MKYIVITSKHHDGFAMFKSKVSPYNIVERDPVQARRAERAGRRVREARHAARLLLLAVPGLAREGRCGKHVGLRPDQAPDGKELKNYDAYLRGKAEPQVKELLTGYGPVALIWFDTPRMMTAERGQRFADFVRTLQPNTLIDGRLGTEGDYRSTGDNVIPPEASAEAWETPATINDTWGFRQDDTNWKSPGQIAFKLVDIVSKGGNYLLNVGPTAEGVIPTASQEILRTVGRWLRVNGEAVYGAGTSPFGEEFGEFSARGGKDVRGQKLFLPQTEWRVTTKPGKLYFTFFAEPRAPFEIPAMKNRATRAYRLADHAPVDLKTENGKTDVHARAADARSDGDRRRRGIRRKQESNAKEVRHGGSRQMARMSGCLRPRSGARGGTGAGAGHGHGVRHGRRLAGRGDPGRDRHADGGAHGYGADDHERCARRVRVPLRDPRFVHDQGRTDGLPIVREAQQRAQREWPARISAKSGSRSAT
jgi:alpha-L-fucosidase